MDGFLDWFFAFLTTMIDGIWKIISGIFGGIFQVFNIVHYFEQFNSYKGGFSVLDWVFAIFSILIVIAIWVIAIYLLIMLIRKYIRFRKSKVGTEELLEEVADLHRDVIKLNNEKERILALKIGQAGVPLEMLKSIYDEEEGEQTEGDADTTEYPTRFAKLDAIDQKYAYYNPPEYRRDFSLEQICDTFRNFAASRMGLFYETKTIRLLFAGLASTKLILLQGISGTGKTSLPYALGKFIENDSTIVSVQPSWRDRTELFGYFNEFSKKFNETDVLRRIYEASYNDDVNIIILDELNIARIEYYFAEMLSIMEMPDATEWKIELVTAPWNNDPKNLRDGKLLIPQNVWYVGTANNDDSTFAVSDKVYDRALTINIDNKGIAFDAPDTPPAKISSIHLNNLFSRAIDKNALEDKYLSLIDELDNYVIKKFRIAFGNRIMKQLKIFVPVYVACGGTVLEGIDHILNTKVFRKFESLNLSLIRDELKGLINYLNTLFGKGTMTECIAFLERLQRTY